MYIEQNWYLYAASKKEHFKTFRIFIHLLNVFPSKQRLQINLRKTCITVFEKRLASYEN